MWLSAKAEKAAGEEKVIRSRNPYTMRKDMETSPALLPTPNMLRCPPAPRAQPVASGVRTAGVVGGRVHVVEVDVARLGHFQVHHVRGVLQGGHGLLVPHILQVCVVHLPEGKDWLTRLSRRALQPCGSGFP